MKHRHLGDDIHDLLDGRLRGDKAYTAVAHLGECEQCTARFKELRAARDALNSSQAGIDMRFAQQLLDRQRIAEIAAAERPGRARATKPPRRTPVVAAVSVVILVMVVVGVAWQVGAPDRVGLEFAASGDGSASTVAYVDTQGMRSGDLLRSWIHPDFESSGLVPVEASVVRSQAGQLALVATLLAGMDRVTVIQQHGQLDAALTESLPMAQVETAKAFVLEEGPSSTVVWQTGDVVVALTCECTLTTLESVAEAFPSAEDPGFVERVADGFDTFADAITP